MEEPDFLVLPFRETLPGLRHAPAVVAIICASALVVALNGPIPSVGRALQMTDVGLRHWQLWRLVTYVLPQENGWLHLVVNMVPLALYGWQLERVVGTVRFALVYFGGGAIGMALLASFRDINAQTGLRSGASLAVFAVVAATGLCCARAMYRRSAKIAWAAVTAGVLLLLAGALSARGIDAVVRPGLDGFAFGVVNHSLGIAAGLIIGGAVLWLGPHDVVR